MLRSLYKRLAAHSDSLWLKRVRALFFVNGVLLVLVVAQLREWPDAVEAVDVEQQRLNIAVPVAPGVPVRQTFQATRAGLTEVELLVTGVGEQNETTGSVTLALSSAEGEQVAAQTWQVAALRSNQSLLLRFPPQAGSAGERYTLSIEASADTNLALGGYDQDVYTEGALTVSSETEWDLRFSTRYQLTPAGALGLLGDQLWQNSRLLLLAPALILLPGVLLLLLWGSRLPRWDPAAWWGVALTLGLACWPLFWYWLTVAGGRWAGWSLGAVLVSGWSAVIGLWWRRKRQGVGLPTRPVDRYHLLLLLLLTLGFAVRLLAVRDLAFPPWVDSTRHALITAVMASKGQFLRDYDPFLGIDHFPYHAGFHTLAAGLVLLGGSALPTLLLITGQLLNALVPLTIYAAAWLVTRRPVAGLIAAFLVALPFFFPAYYLSWGRLTQLTGVLLLPILVALTWLVAEARGGRKLWWLVGLLAAGLALSHMRVFLVYVPFVPIAWLVAGRGRGTRAFATATLLALLLVGPRLAELLQSREGAFSSAGTTYNDFPFSYVTLGWEKFFVIGGGVALIIAIRPALRSRPWALFALALGAWSGALLLLLSYIPSIWLINLNSAYIIFFVPLALILGVVGAAVEAWWRQRGLRMVTGYSLAGALFALLLLFGLHQQITILNPITRLARPADQAGIAWVEKNLPPEAMVAVNSWQWLGSTWAGSDGGAWLLPLSGLQTTTPPADYVYSAELLREVDAFNEKAQAVEDWAEPAAAQWLADEGVTHIFVGARGGFFDPSALARNPELELLYNSSGVFVFALKPSPANLP